MMNSINNSPQLALSPNTESEKWKTYTAYVLVVLSALLVSISFFLTAFLRFEENPDGMFKDPIPIVETFWQFSSIASILMLAIAITAVVLVITKHSRKIIYVAIIATIVCFGAVCLHEQAKQAKLSDSYLGGEHNSKVPSDINLAVGRFADSLDNIKRFYSKSEVYGTAWKILFFVLSSYWIVALIQFNKTEYKNAWNWTLSKIPIFEQKMKQCQSCGRANFLDANRCKYCEKPFV